MNDTKMNYRRDREFSSKILSASFTLLGLSIGFYGVIFAEIGEAGPWIPERSELLPFLIFMTFVIVLNCVLAILAVLDMSGYLHARIALALLTCSMLASISLFVVVRLLQI